MQQPCNSSRDPRHGGELNVPVLSGLSAQTASPTTTRCAVDAFTANVSSIGGNSKTGFNMSANRVIVAVIFLGILLLGSETDRDGVTLNTASSNAASFLTSSDLASQRNSRQTTRRSKFSQGEGKRLRRCFCNAMGGTRPDQLTRLRRVVKEYCWSTVAPFGFCCYLGTACILPSRNNS